MLAKAYRYVVDHLTKALGTLGGLLMTVAFMDPAPIRDAAKLYLGDHSAAKVATFLFVMVWLRGWYTGQKAKQLAAAAAATPAPAVAAS